MVSAFYVRSKALTVNNVDGDAGLPTTNKDEIKRLDYSYASYDRPNNFVFNFIYQGPSSPTAPSARSPTTGSFPASTVGERPALPRHVFDPASATRT